jgi:wyosine [tRNA(Phe)-imidazoG37] synthetase (radical SAM superfamily)
MGYIFGPVPSRRLGRSLGVDLVPFKTCSYDCIYCQLGRTTDKTIERRDWVPLDQVMDELKDKLDSRPDYITLSGSGEPTLYSRIDETIARIRSMTDTPIAVLTNGSLLWQKEVRSQIMDAHLVVPSLDAGNQEMFDAVNRPHQDVSFDRMLEGLISFRNEYRGQYWLEVVILDGYTAASAEAEQIAQCAAKIKPDRIQLNTVTRPPAEDYAATVDRRRLEELAVLFDPPAEIVADFRGVHAQKEFTASRETVLNMLKRRPCSIDDIAEGISIHRNEAVKYIEELLAMKLIEKFSSAGKIYFRVC